ncbi:MarR family winged helix-turn-helix transcriptional regulator [Nesterenkonia ebinurensis]|uniref:MarR family winged helix-turn-helix transcriptional regulator n=1 Tax=Nesterenkonia ebinurensis TaxID=2608252 RepID=UPI00123CAAE3|nr:MarR family transcriptional regulator [Nesterenkonia ebinurensis]
MVSEDRRAHVKELQQELHRLFLRRRHNAIQLARTIDPEIEPAAYSILFTLQREGAQRMTDISKHLGVGKPTLSRQLTTLAERGFITKKADPADGRALVISLTEQGKSRLDAAQKQRSERYLHMLEVWSEEEIMTLSGLVAKLNQTYAEYDDGPGAGARSPAAVSADPKAA